MAFMRRILFVLLFFLSLATLPSGALCVSQEEMRDRSFEAQGRGSIKAGNFAQARRDAIQDALRKAVAQAVAGILSETEARKAAKVLTDTIYADAERYVQTYRITGEDPGDGAYKVAVRVTVATEDILRDLAASGVFERQGGTAPVHDLVVVVRGIESYGHYVNFRELLKNCPKGVRRVRPRLIAWREAEFAVTLQGEAESFAGDLKQTGQFTPEMIDISRGRIEGTISSERIR